MRPVFQAAACEAPARADAIADASSGPSRGEAAARSVLTDRDDTPCYPFGILRPADRSAINSTQRSQRPSRDVITEKQSPQLPIAVKVLAGKIGPSGPSARSRPLAKGCAFTSQARPLGCGTVLQQESVRQDRAGRSPAAEARCSSTSQACSAGCAPIS